jgi:hypothetical protein
MVLCIIKLCTALVHNLAYIILNQFARWHCLGSCSFYFLPTFRFNCHQFCHIILYSIKFGNDVSYLQVGVFVFKAKCGQVGGWNWFPLKYNFCEGQIIGVGSKIKLNFKRLKSLGADQILRWVKVVGFVLKVKIE